MSTAETGYNREALKTQLQELAQKIARVENGETVEGENLNDLHAKYELLESQLGEHSEMQEAA